MTQSQGRIVKAILLLVLGVGMFVLVIDYADVKDWGRLLDIRLQPALLVLLFVACSISLVSIRWKTLSDAFGGKNVSLASLYRCQALAAFLGQVLPKELTDFGGRTYWLQRQDGHTLFTAGLSVFWDRIFDILVLPFTLPSSIAFFTMFFPDHIAAIVILTTGIAVGASMTATGHKWMVKAALPVLAAGAAFLGRFSNKLRMDTGYDIPQLSKKTVFFLFMISTIKTASFAMASLCSAWAFDLDISPWVILFGTPISQVAFIFSFTAGGLGVLEAGWLAVMTVAGVPSEDIGIFLIGQRLIITACQFIIAAVTWTGYRMSKQ